MVRGVQLPRERDPAPQVAAVARPTLSHGSARACSQATAAPLLPRPTKPPRRAALLARSAAVDGGHRAVIWNRFSGGIQDDVVGEGTHFRIPFVSYPTMFDV